MNFSFIWAIHAWCNMLSGIQANRYFYFWWYMDRTLQFLNAQNQSLVCSQHFLRIFMEIQEKTWLHWEKQTILDFNFPWNFVLMIQQTFFNIFFYLEFFFRTFRNVCARHYNRIFNAKHLRIWHYLCVYEFRQHIQWKFFHGIPMKVFLFVFGQLHMWSVLIETVYFANFYCFYSNGIYVNTIFINGCSISHSDKTCNEMELIL